MAATESEGSVITVDDESGVGMTDEHLDTDSESDSDSVESLEDEEYEKAITELKRKLAENPFIYDLHVENINLVRAHGDLDGVREAREKMHSIFPLTEALWIEWLQDEIKVSTPNLQELFDRAVKDYLSVGVWLEYVQYIIGVIGEESGIQKARTVFERAISAAGLHFTKGVLIWDAYREFEMAILMGLQPAPGSIPSQDQQKQIEAQTDRVASLFRRQLAVPLLDTQKSFIEYKEWCTEDVDPQMEQTLAQTTQKLQKLLPLEDKVISSAAPHLAEFQRYIDYEVSQGEPARIQCIYERALQENCLNHQLWIKYTKYLDTQLKVADLVLSVYERSVRNCPWCPDLWLGFTQASERHLQSPDQTKGIFEQAIKSGFSQGPHYLQIWTGYCDFLRRRVPLGNKDCCELQDLRDIFRRAISHLQEYYPNDGDTNCTLLQYWARLEAKYYGKMEQSRELWNEILQQGFANQAASWLEYLNLEKAYGDHKHCRKLLQRAVNSVSDFPETVCQAYINFEREEGTLEQLDQASVRCESQLQRVEERRAKAAEKEAQQTEQKKKQRDTKKYEKKSDRKQQTQIIKKSEISGGRSVGQKRKHEDITKTDSEGFKVPPPPGVKPKVPRVETASNDDVPPNVVSGPPPGYKPKKPVVNVPQETSHELMETEATQLSRNDESSVFVSNLGYKINEAQIQDFFSDVGQIKEVRLVKTQKGVSRGFAYVEFVDQLPVEKALALDREKLDGRPLFVSRCEEKSQKTQVFKYNTGMERCKLFVKGLPFTCTEEALRTIFTQHGTLKSVRIVTYRTGASKGMAYVEYDEETSATQAVMKTDGLKIGENTISVDISNPPERKAPQKESVSFTPTLGGGKTVTLERGKARTQISMFKPRSLQKSVPSDMNTKQSSSDSSSADSKTSDSNSQGKLSNTDFRKLLLNPR